MNKKFIDELSDLKDIRISENVLINSTIKISAIFKYKIDIFHVDDIVKVMDIIKKYNVKYYILGNCSNILFKKKHYDGVIVNVHLLDKQEGILSASENVNKINFEYINKGIKSLVFMSGIPSSVGGAIYMNAGAYNKEMKDIIENVCFYDINSREIKTFNKEECEFSYRNSYFQRNKTIILYCKVKLIYDNKDIILSEYKRIMELRRSKLPIYPSLGSVFKNLSDLKVGYLIDQANLKGLMVNDAKVSHEHANVIVNTNNAKGRDVISLIKIIKKKIHKKYKRDLELEIIILNN